MNQQSNHERSIGIVGLGLIGGSLGIDLQTLGWTVNGLVNKAQTAKRAKERGLATIVSRDPKVLSNCELIILALPLDQLLHPSKELVDSLPAKAVITDVGSVKAPVLDLWEKLHPRFIASHPMAGSNEAGVEAGRKGLFKNRPWVITPNQSTEHKALEILKEIVIKIGSNFLIANAKKHDEAVALISHLPVIISAALLKSVNIKDDPILNELTKDLASSGFLDTSRVGAGNPSLGTLMAKYNANKLSKSLDHYKKSLSEFEQIILSENWDELQKELEETQAIRNSYLISN